MCKIPPFHLGGSRDRLARWARIPEEGVPPIPPGQPGIKSFFHPVLSASAFSTGPIVSLPRLSSIIASQRGNSFGFCDSGEYLQYVSTTRNPLSSVQVRPCVVPADAFHVVRDTSNTPLPCSFSLSSGEIFGMAGILEFWTVDEHTVMQRFSLIRVAANSLLRPFFDSTPAIIQQRDQEQWLYRGHNALAAFELLRPISAVELKRWFMMPYTQAS